MTTMKVLKFIEETLLYVKLTQALNKQIKAMILKKKL